MFSTETTSQARVDYSNNLTFCLKFLLVKDQKFLNNDRNSYITISCRLKVNFSLVNIIGKNLHHIVAFSFGFCG